MNSVAELGTTLALLLPVGILDARHDLGGQNDLRSCVEGLCGDARVTQIKILGTQYLDLSQAGRSCGKGHFGSPLAAHRRFQRRR